MTDEPILDVKTDTRSVHERYMALPFWVKNRISNLVQRWPHKLSPKERLELGEEMMAAYRLGVGTR